MNDLASIDIEALDQMFWNETKNARAAADKAGLLPAGTDESGAVIIEGTKKINGEGLPPRIPNISA